MLAPAMTRSNLVTSEVSPVDVKDARRDRLGCRVRVAIQGVLVNDELLIPRADIERAAVQEEHGSSRVVLDTRSGAVELRVPTKEDAEAIRVALGVDAARPASSVRIAEDAGPVTRTFRVASPVPWGLAGGVSFVGLILATIGVFLLWPHWRPWDFHSGPAPVSPYYFWIVLSIVTMVLSMIKATVTVRSDAVVRRWLGFERVVPLGEIVAAQLDDGAVRVHRRSKRPWWIWGVAVPGKTVRDPARSGLMTPAEQLAGRIEEARLARERSADSAVGLHLARNSRGLEDWIRALRAVTAEGDFRAGAVPRDRLWSVVEDAAASPRTRVAAAVALSASLPEDEKQRLRVAADATDEPRFRVAIDAVLDDREIEIAEALETLDA